MSLLVAGGELKAREGRGEAIVQLLPVADLSFEAGSVALTAKTKEPAILWSSVGFRKETPERLEQLRRQPEAPERRPDLEAAARDEEDANAKRITSFAVREPGGRTVILETGPLGRANAMMRDCARDQLISWGVDPAVQEKIVKPARTTSLVKLFSSKDYPASAVNRGEQSIIQARLNIGADGRVTHCTSLTFFEAPGFAEVVCKKLRTARYTPAELADGTKVATYDMATIRFVLPD